jgi:carbon monoxide dehydrogenase subunit G
MAKVVRSVNINVPVEKVFEYLNDPLNLLEIWPSLVEVSDVKRTPDGVGSTNRWAYKLAGMRFEGKAEIVEYIENERVVTKASGGGMEATHTHTYEGTNGGTKFTCESVYTIPIPVLGKLAEAVVVKLNENEADVFMANLKARLET